MNASSASRQAQAIVERLCRENPDATDSALREAFADVVSKDDTLKGIEYPDGNVTEDWLCVDCGINTAPGIPDGITCIKQINATGESKVRVGPDTEVYSVRDAVWAKAGMEPFGGCLCIGCLEKRLGRRLKPKDFLRDDPFNTMPGTPRLMDRRGGR
jgi:hypothetical protein